MLYYYDGTKYWAWALTTVSNVKTSVPATIISESNGVTTNNQSPDDDYALPRGKALFVYRPNGSTDGDIYLYGALASTAMSPVATVANGYTLIGNPFAAPLPIKSIVAVSGAFTASDTASDADFIELWEDGGYSRKYFFSSDAGDAWSSDQDGYDETDDTIPAGLGFWFYRQGSEMTVKLPVPYSL